MDLIITRPPLDLRTAAVAVGCLLGAGLAGYLLYLDARGGPVRGHGAPLGVVEKSDSFVRRKLSDSYLWDPIDANDALYRHDAIQTGPASSARIRLNDGSIIDLGEESLVVIDKQAKMSLDFVRGSAVVHDTQGDRAVRVQHDGKTEVRILSAQLKTPDAFSTLYARHGSGRAVDFSWSLRQATPNSSSARDITLEVSTDRIFSAGSTRSFPIAAGSGSDDTVVLSPGTYFWRILKERAPISVTRRFEISDLKPLQPLWPASNLAVPRKAPGDLLQFRWGGAVASSRSGKSWIEISPDHAFQERIRSFPVISQSLTAAIPEPDEGHYYWRIRSRFPGLELTSDAVEFQVVKPGSPTLTQPRPQPKPVESPRPIELLTPADGETILFWHAPASGFLLSWKDLPRLSAAGATYQVEVSTDPAFKTGELVEMTQQPRLDGARLKLGAGTHYWRARLLDKSGHLLDSSPVRRFSCALNPPLAPPARLAPPNGAVFRLNTLDREPEVGWEPVPSAVSYEVAFYRAGRAVLRERIRNNRLSLGRLGPGDYVWSVRSVDPLGRAGPASPARRVSISTGKALPPPEVLQRTRVVE